jgi:tetratricopeptide (TPR) repeat protein
LDGALGILDDGIATDRHGQSEGYATIHKHMLKAFVYEEKKDFDSALREASSCVEIAERFFPEDPVRMRDFYVHVLGRSGRVEEALQVAGRVKRDLDEKGDDSLMYLYWAILGSIEQARGNVKAAVGHWEKAAGVMRRHWRGSYQYYGVFGARCYLAQAYLESGRPGEAANVLEKALSRYDRFRSGMPIQAVKAYYLLGLAYEKTGRTAKAIEQYEEFLDIWKSADPRIEEIEDARARLARLKSAA